MFNLFTRHHIRPGEVFSLPRGEQLMLIAFSDKEIELEARREVGRRGK